MKSVKLKATAGRTAGSGVLNLQGNLTLDCAEEILRFLREGAKKYKDVRLVCTQVAALDLSFLQLLHSYSTYQASRNADFKVELNLEPDLAQLIRTTGLAQWVDSVARPN